MHSACWAVPVTSRHTEYIFEAEPVDLQVKQIEGGYEVEGTSALQVPGHFTWGGSVSKAEDGKYYMIYSAPETGVHPFNNAWVFGSKLGLAVSERPDGGFRQLGFFYNQDGFAADTLLVGCPKHFKSACAQVWQQILPVLCGNSRSGNDNAFRNRHSPKRDRVQQNQKIGVIVFEPLDLLKGKFTHWTSRCLSRARGEADNVLAPSPQGTEPKPIT